MAGIKEIQKRRKGAVSTRKITKTMGMIAASKFRKAMDRAEGATPYINTINQLVVDLMSQASFQHPLLEKREKVKKEIIFLVTSNQGLCGSYNSNLNKLAKKTIEESSDHQVDFHISGKKGISYFKTSLTPVTKKYTDFSETGAFEPIEAIAQQFIDAYSRKEVDRISVIYSKFISSSKQFSTLETLLPFTLDKAQSVQTPASMSTEKGKVDFLYIPSPAEILEELLPQAVKAKFFKYFLDAIASEHVSRMVAMKSATDNADKMIKKLTQLYNRARQSKITMEILEILGGAEAIS
ncbi:MAG: ATP synthase F1 subunit gamma [Planctomycetota bacterium]